MLWKLKRLKSANALTFEHDQRGQACNGRWETKGRTCKEGQVSLAKPAEQELINDCLGKLERNGVACSAPAVVSRKTHLPIHSCCWCRRFCRIVNVCNYDQQLSWSQIFTQSSKKCFGVENKQPAEDKTDKFDTKISVIKQPQQLQVCEQQQLY